MKWTSRPSVEHPRSNPATYTGVFSDIRKLFEQTRESKIRGYKAGRFSFNVKGGRCETCQGAGLQTIEMNFLPDVYVHCNECNGKRYNRETLEVQYKGKNISDVLDMTISQAVEFFSRNIPAIRHKLDTIDQVGLGYITLGQPSTTFRVANRNGSNWLLNFRKKIPEKPCIFWMNPQPDFILKMSGYCSKY